MVDNETYHLTATESPVNYPRPVPMLLQEPPLQICGLRHPLYNAEGGARRCAWLHLVGALIAFCCAGILAYRSAGLGWPLAAGLVFLVTSFAGFTACIYRLTLTILVSMISCLISASFAIIMILWAAFSIAHFLRISVESDNYDENQTLKMTRTMKMILSIHVILGVVGIAELVTCIVHSVKAIRIICCFRDAESEAIKRQGSRLVPSPGPYGGTVGMTSLVIENPHSAGHNDKASAFV